MTFRFRMLSALVGALAAGACADDTKAAATATTGDATTVDVVAVDTAAADTVAADTAAGDSAMADAQAPAPNEGVAILGSDFKSTTISTADRAARKALASNFLNSGTVVTPGGTALSGDVVLGHTAHAKGRFVLVDRAKGVLTWVDATTKKATAQLDVSTKFAANPQDCIDAPAGKAWVTRMGVNPKATPAADDFDDGDDVLVIDTAKNAIVGRISLAAATTGTSVLAGPGKATWDGAVFAGAAPGLSKLWVPLAMLSGDFKSAAPGKIAAIQPGDGSVAATLDLPGAKNCVAAATVGPGSVLVACQGFFGDGPKQIDGSNLMLVNSTNDKPFVTTAVAAKTLAKGPFGKDLACFGDGRWCVATTAGDFAAKTTDVLWLVDVKSGSAKELGKAAGAFAFSGLYADAVARRAWVGEKDAAAGDVRVFSVPTGDTPAVAELAAFKSNPASLGAVDIVGFPL